MRFVHPLMGVLVIDRLGLLPTLTESYGDWVLTNEADAALVGLWRSLAGRLTAAGASVAAVDVCGNSPSLIRACPGWEAFPARGHGRWNDQFVNAVAGSAPCWLEVKDATSCLLMVMDGGFDRMVVTDGRVDLRGVL